MIRKTVSPKPHHVRVIFELPACIWADHIFLVGDFNDWNVTATPFVQGRDGVWRAVLDLPEGKTYQFRYLVDGNWQTDFHADGWIQNEYGSQNSLVVAALPQTEPAPSPQPQLVPEKVARQQTQPLTQEPRLTSAELTDAVRRLKKMQEQKAAS